MGHSQTFNEWFRQRKTQRRYLRQQIVALRVYLGHLKKGYSIVQKGLNAVGDIKDGKFSLDADYLESLGTVNTVISSSGKVPLIAAHHRAILSRFNVLDRTCNDSEFLTNDEKHYVAMVRENMFRECEISLDELDRVLSDAEFEMKDDERLKRVDFIYGDMKGKAAFAISFSNSVKLLMQQRMGEVLEIGRSNKLSNESE